MWALVDYLRLVDGDVDEAAAAFELPREAVDAALAYYRRNNRQLPDGRWVLYP